VSILHTPWLNSILEEDKTVGKRRKCEEIWVIPEKVQDMHVVYLQTLELTGNRLDWHDDQSHQCRFSQR